MTLLVNVNKVTFQGNGVTTVWPYTFPIPLASYLRVLLTSAAGIITDVTAQCSVTGIGSSVGGNVTYPTSGPAIAAPIAGAVTPSIAIMRVLPITQPVSYTNQGNYYPDVTELSFDDITMIAQQLQEIINRALIYPAVDQNPTVTMPTAQLRANQALMFDANGNPTVGLPSAAPVSVALQPVVAAASLAAALILLGGAPMGLYTASGLTLNAARLLGRITAGVGAAEEISMGVGLSLAAATLGVSLTTITNILGADVALNNTGNFFTGPTCAQGVAGTWECEGVVTVQDTAGAAKFYARLWDGTTVIDSCIISTSAANAYGSAPLGGIIAAPAGNIRMDVKDLGSTSGFIRYNDSGLGKDSTLTVIRIA